MKFGKSSYGGTVEILATSRPHIIPAKISGTTIVKAGMPITEAGAASPSGTGAVGILLYDVDPTENPNCALVVGGPINWKKCMEHSGATATAATMKSILPGITFRENIGVNTDSTDDDDDDDNKQG